FSGHRTPCAALLRAQTARAGYLRRLRTTQTKLVVMLSRRTLLASLCGSLCPPPRLWAAAPISIPARRNDFNQLLVPARIDGSPPLWCELDSGGGGALVFIEAAKASAMGILATSVGRSAGP